MLSVTHYGIQYDNQLTDTGNEYQFLDFPAFTNAVVFGFENRVALNGGHHPHEDDRVSLYPFQGFISHTIVYGQS